MHYLIPVFAALISFAASTTQAREVGDLYLSASAAVLFPQDVEVGTLPKIRVETAGYHVELSFGGYIISNVRWELANTYRRYEFKDSDEGFLGAYIPFVNIYYDPLGIKDRHDPYIGVGVGVGLWDFHDFSDDDPPTDPEAAFALNVMAGYNFFFTESLALGMSYRFAYSEPEFFNDLRNYKQFHHSLMVTTTFVF